MPVPVPAPAAPAPPARPDEVPPERRRKNSKGEWIVDPLVKDLFQSEVAVLKLLSSKSKINVPRLIDGGLDANGLAFVETELWPGIPGSRVKEECRMPDGARHVDSGECTMCEDKALANADSYIADVVLPELEKLTSNTMGLDGMLVPPPWVRYYDNNWLRKTSDTDRYVFTNWDLGLHNIMFEDGTLDVIGAYDWEEGSAFWVPPDFHTVNCSQQELDAMWEVIRRVSPPHEACPMPSADEITAWLIICKFRCEDTDT